MTRQLRSTPELSSFLRRSRSRSTWATRGVAGLCAAALAVSACGSDAAESSAQDGETDLATAMLGMTEEEFQARTEQLVQECMTAKGWEYEITTLDQLQVVGDEDPEEFARENGYGAFGFSGDAGVAVAAPGSGSGNDYLDSLSPADLDAYYADLFGQFDEESTDIGGCMGEANEEVAGPGGMEAMNARFQKLTELIQADSEVIEATRAWSACMADAGYAYNTPDEAMNDFFTRSQSVDFNDEAAVAAARTEEIAVAVADQECQGSAGLTEANEAAVERAVEQLGSN